MKCNQKVKYQYSWGGQLKLACEEHMHQIQIVANVIGANCDYQAIKSKEKCPNEVEE